MWKVKVVEGWGDVGKLSYKDMTCVLNTHSSIPYVSPQPVLPTERL